MAQLPVEPPKLIAITDVATHGFETTRVALRRLCEGARAGSVLVQCRDRELSGRRRLEWARELRLLTSTYEQLLFVNDRVDIALICGADGIHLGQQSMRVDDVVRCGDAASQLQLSGAWHREDEAPSSALQYLLVSPVMAPRKGNRALGVAGLLRFVDATRGRWVYALGGVEPQHVAELLAAGATGVAAIGAVVRQPGALMAALAIER